MVSMEEIFDITKFREMFLACEKRGGTQPNGIFVFNKGPLPFIPMWCLMDGVRLNPPRMWGMQACPGAYKRI